MAHERLRRVDHNLMGTLVETCHPTGDLAITSRPVVTAAITYVEK